MKRLPIVKRDKKQEGSTPEPVWFQTIAELEKDEAVEESRLREFAMERPFEPPQGVDRRTFMTLAGASLAMAGLAGCRRQEEHVLPFSHNPEDFVPGRAEYYATAIPIYGTTIGLLAKSVDGRPIKLEGNPLHADSLGGTTTFVQASVLDLYDPNRSHAPRKQGKDVSHDDAWKFLGDLGRDLKGKGGHGLAVLTEDHRSLTTGLALSALRRMFSQVEIYRFEAFGRENQQTGYAAALGEPREISYELDKADVIVCLDADILGTESNPVKSSKGFAKRRRVEDGHMNRLYVAEPCPSVTGNPADHRMRIQAKRVGELLKGLAAALGAAGVPVADGLTTAAALNDAEKKWVDAAAKDLARARGKGVVAVAPRQPMALHALAAALNHALGAIGNTVKLSLLADDTYTEQDFQGVGGIAQLVKNLQAGKIDTLLILGGNPAFNAPADLKFEEAVKQAKTSIHLSSYVDETSAGCTWHIPRAHFLESWSDAVSDSGTHSVIQPLIAPMYGGRTDAEVLERIVGGTRTPYELVTAT